MENERARLAVGLDEAARMLNISRRTLEGYVAAKSLPTRKIGRRRVVMLRSLDEFLRHDHPSLGQRQASVVGVGSR